MNLIFRSSIVLCICVLAPAMVCSQSRGRSASGSTSHVKSGASSGDLAPFVMRISLEHVANGGASRTCATVYPDLRYHLERSEQHGSFQGKPRVYESTITPEQLDTLRRLLDAAELKSLEHNDMPERIAVQEADFTILSVLRDSGVQNLAFASYFGIRNDRRDTSKNAAASRYATDEDVKVVKPVRQWVKEAIESRKVAETKGATATDCVP
jgi:hypothetical protein